MDEFMTGFGIIAMKCREFYRMLSLDGDADLDLVDSYNPFTKGVTLNIRPPKKSWRSIMQLSGGEKTLSSLAFVFAIHHFRPSPMYLMDEIDAALDTRNVTIVGNLIQHLSDHTQFIVISLRESMFRLCNRLVGIYKVEDCTGFMVINNITILNQIQMSILLQIIVNCKLNFQYTREDSNLVEVIMKNQIFIENPIIMPICDESTSNIDNDISSSSSSSPPPSKKTKIQ
ncbi:structural maintenance of chromosomes protein 4-like [Ctenocephalides felis]|uniref:structural maintenance of chromosomes protein 4-like n=1 Tax=Ctenocephalides felis TaxID=7515 RepID=UPI000E6E520A|nr:structural maintenance of chromosomes protein 4-like [Ctenocephalides felis]